MTDSEKKIKDGKMSPSAAREGGEEEKEQEEDEEKKEKEEDEEKKEKEKKAQDEEDADADGANAMEEVLKAMGGCGKFQWMMVISLKLGLVPMAWSMLLMAFGGIVPDWWCLPPSSYHRNLSSSSSSFSSSSSSSSSIFSSSSFSANGGLESWSRDNTTYRQCEVPGSPGESCLGHVVFDQSVKTVISEWGLVCGRQHLKALMTSMQMVGVLVGACVAGQASDALGRRVVCYATLLWHAVSTLVAAFSVSWEMFLGMRVLIGMAVGSYFVSSYPFCFEFVGTKHRQMVGFTPGWNLGLISFALGAWLMPNWSHLHIATCVLTLPILLTWFVVPESARWLATRGRLQEAEAVVERVARRNGRSKPAYTGRAVQQVALHERRAGQGRRYTYLNVYQGWRMALTSLVINFIWISLALTYYGIAFGVSALSGNFYLNMFLMNIIEIPAKIVFVFVADRLGRRRTCFLLFILCSVSSFAILVVEKTATDEYKGSVTTALAMVSKVSVGTVWMVTATFTSELYPTVVRSLGYGACNTFARVGGALAPTLLNMDTASDVVRAYIIVGAVMGLSGIAVLFLRETRGQGLQDSIIVKVTAAKVKVGSDNNGFLSEKPEQRVWMVEEKKKKDGESGQDRGKGADREKVEGGEEETDREKGEAGEEETDREKVEAGEKGKNRMKGEVGRKERSEEKRAEEDGRKDVEEMKNGEKMNGGVGETCQSTILSVRL